MTIVNESGAADKGADSTSPKALPVNADAVPDALTAIERWVVWRYVEEVDPETGEVDYDKPPLNAGTGRAASSTNPKTWSTFDDALSAYERGDMDGVGFVLHRSKDADGFEERGGLIGVDLDHCRDAATGVIDEWALQIIRDLDTYAEASPSGEGVRLFLYGDLPAHGRKRGNFECYQSGRYVTVTGNHIVGTPTTIEHRQAAIDPIHFARFGDGKAKISAPSQGGWRPSTLGDAELIRRAGESKSGERFLRLWRGEIAGTKSPSEADLALCNYLAFWAGPDENRIADLFAQSGLYRTKWNRPDYRQRTIAKALAGRTEFFGSKRQYANFHGGNGHCNGAGPSTNGPTEASEDEDAANLTDRGNAIRLAREHGQDLRHVHPWRKWLCWDGRRWRMDDSGAVTLRAKRLIAALFRWAVKQVEEIQKQLEEQSDAG